VHDAVLGERWPHRENHLGAAAPVDRPRAREVADSGRPRVGSGQDREDARLPRRGARVDRSDRGGGVRRADESGKGVAGLARIVDEAAFPPE
jgi:hypothetical protein